MKKIILILFTAMLLTISNAFCQNRSILFLEKPWAEILQQAKNENKVIFLDAYAVWCGPCKWMAANIFTNDTLADYFNKTFICTKFDMEKGEGKYLAGKFAVNAYPTLLFIDTAGNMIHKKVGADREVKDYIHQAMLAQNPNECLTAYIRKYKAGAHSPGFMLTYFDRISDTYTPVDEPLKKYFVTQSDADLLSRSNWLIIYKYVNDIKSREFQYLVNHHTQYEYLYSKDSVEHKISEAFRSALIGFVRSRNYSQEGYDKLRKEILDSSFLGAPKSVFSAELTLCLFRGEMDKFLELAYNGVDQYYNNDAHSLYEIAIQVKQLSQDPKYTEKADSWIQRSAQLKESTEKKK